MFRKNGSTEQEITDRLANAEQDFHADSADVRHAMPIAAAYRITRSLYHAFHGKVNVEETSITYEDNRHTYLS